MENYLLVALVAPRGGSLENPWSPTELAGLQSSRCTSSALREAKIKVFTGALGPPEALGFPVDPLARGIPTHLLKSRQRNSPSTASSYGLINRLGLASTIALRFHFQSRLRIIMHIGSLKFSRWSESGVIKKNQFFFYLIVMVKSYQSLW